VDGSPPPQRGPRLRELGLRLGVFEAGPANAITDVPGVSVGHVTVWRDEPEPPAGRGVARTGVTAIVPGDPGSLVQEPAPASAAVLNGAGELTGFVQISEWGAIQTPVYLTSTMAVGRVYDGAVAAAVAADPAVGVEDVVIPVVGECDDSHLSEARVVQVEAADAGRAVAAAAGGAVAEGAVGAGTGMVAFGFKAGIGTASRFLHGLDATLGALVLANFGERHTLRVAGVPIGELLAEGEAAGGRKRPAGSCICVLATDAPLGAAQLERLARRAGLGLARTGSVAHHGSGEIFLAFSTSGRRPREERSARVSVDAVPDGLLDGAFEAAVDAVEEAVLNALWAAPSVTGREGRTVDGIPHEPVLELLGAHGRL
jgi:D-aminopeptidase